MPRYFFHLDTPRGLERDDIGLDFAGPDDAYLEACRAIPELTADILRDRGRPTDCTFLIADEAGDILLQIPFTELVAGRARANASALARPDLMKNMLAAQQIARSTSLKGLEIQRHLEDAHKNLAGLKNLLESFALFEKSNRAAE
jgi:hypothetical protein